MHSGGEYTLYKDGFADPYVFCSFKCLIKWLINNEWDNDW